MKKYEYKFVEIPRKKGLKVSTGDTFEECRRVITVEVEKGWRLKRYIFCGIIGLPQKSGNLKLYMKNPVFQANVRLS